MPVPETSMYENYRSISWQDQIRAAWQSLRMEAIAEPGSMQSPAYDHFWSGILRPDTGHHPAADLC